MRHSTPTETTGSETLKQHGVRPANSKVLKFLTRSGFFWSPHKKFSTAEILVNPAEDPRAPLIALRVPRTLAINAAALPPDIAYLGNRDHHRIFVTSAFFAISARLRRAKQKRTKPKNKTRK